MSCLGKHQSSHVGTLQSWQEAQGDRSERPAHFGVAPPPRHELGRSHTELVPSKSLFQLAPGLRDSTGLKLTSASGKAVQCTEQVLHNIVALRSIKSHKDLSISTLFSDS